MTRPERQRLRETFGEDAALYDRSRPTYPAKLFDQLAASGPARVLEIGCGTGQATLPLAQRGCTMVGVELSPDMAALARRRLNGFPDAQIVVSAFEDWPLPHEGFDLVVSATAFHWLDPRVRMIKAADALRPGGILALISTHHVAGGTEPFFDDVQRCYERFMPGTPPALRLPGSADVPEDPTEFEESGRFGPVSFRRYEWERTYTTREYQDLLLTYSGHRALPDFRRRDLLACIGDLIERRYDGRVTKRYLNQLATARRASR